MQGTDSDFRSHFVANQSCCSVEHQQMEVGTLPVLLSLCLSLLVLFLTLVIDTREVRALREPEMTTERATMNA